MKLRGIFKVSQFHNLIGGSISWRVQGTKHDGTMIRSNFRSEAEAVARKQQLEIEAMNGDASMAARVTRLTTVQLVDAETALSLVKDKATLTGLAQFWLQNYRDPLTVKSVGAAVIEFLKAKKDENCREDTLRNLRDRVGRFARASGAVFEINKDKTLTYSQPGRNISEILPVHVHDFIHRPDLSPIAKSNDRRALSNFFNWCQQRGYCVESPLLKVGTINLDDAEPVVMPLDRVRKLICAAATFKRGKLLPYVALGLFAGLRPKEIARISWDDIDIKQKTVTLGPKVAKMRSRRVVDLSSNLIAWLRPHADKRTSLTPKNWRKDYDVLKAVAGYAGRKVEPADGEAPQLESMAQDMLRHTAISHHLSMYQHEGKTATWAGNSPDIIHRHYKGLVTQKQSKEFWSIRPAKPTSKKIIALRDAA